jgi:hypothetical protein
MGVDSQPKYWLLYRVLGLLSWMAELSSCPSRKRFSVVQAGNMQLLDEVDEQFRWVFDDLEGGPKSHVSKGAEVLRWHRLIALQKMKQTCVVLRRNWRGRESDLIISRLVGQVPCLEEGLPRQGARTNLRCLHPANRPLAHLASSWDL